MQKFIVTGQKPLRGTITASGRKNAALKLIAASVISDQPVILHNLPAIGDVTVMFSILKSLGVTVDHSGDSVTLQAADISSTEIDSALGKKLRASLVLIGPLLARKGTATFSHPGGDLIGKRSITPHLQAFKDLGASVELNEEAYTIQASHLAGTTIYLKERSVTATENLVMAAVRAFGKTTIINAAEETHITNLCDLLRAMGFSISGDGTSTITIEGDPEVATKPAEIAIIPDEIEVGTYAVAAAITKGDITIEKVGTRTQLLPILSKLEDFGVHFDYNESQQSLHVTASDHLTAAAIQTNPWPGFPSDLQSPFTVLATQAKGMSLVHDWMYEGRLYFVDQLQRMGADILICDPHRAIVNGPTPLRKISAISPDIRAGVALLLAALIAEGTSVIEHAELIDRGYAKIEENLKALGASITRE